MSSPYVVVEGSEEQRALGSTVTTVGRGAGVDLRLEDPSVSRLHAELVRRGPHVYVADLGLSANGTRVNGRPVGRRVLQDGDVVAFGRVRVRVGGLPGDAGDDVVALRRAAPELTRRERDVLRALCRPALEQQAFVAPSTPREIAAALVVTEAAVKQHLVRLYRKFAVPEGVDRRRQLANAALEDGLVRLDDGPAGT